MKISVTLGASQDTSHHKFSLDDLGVTEQEWNEMSESEKKDLIQNAVNDLHDQPYWITDSFSEE
jgi:hypothetical protein